MFVRVNCLLAQPRPTLIAAAPCPAYGSGCCLLCFYSHSAADIKQISAVVFVQGRQHLNYVTNDATRCDFKMWHSTTYSDRMIASSRAIPERIATHNREMQTHLNWIIEPPVCSPRQTRRPDNLHLAACEYRIFTVVSRPLRIRNKDPEPDQNGWRQRYTYIGVHTSYVRVTRRLGLCRVCPSVSSVPTASSRYKGRY